MLRIIQRKVFAHLRMHEHALAKYEGRAHVPTMSSIWCSSSPAWVVPGPGPGARARAQGGEQMRASQCALMSILFDSPVLVMR